MQKYTFSILRYLDISQLTADPQPEVPDPKTEVLRRDPAEFNPSQQRSAPPKSLWCGRVIVQLRNSLHRESVWARRRYWYDIVRPSVLSVHQSRCDIVYRRIYWPPNFLTFSTIWLDYSFYSYKNPKGTFSWGVKSDGMKKLRFERNRRTS